MIDFVPANRQGHRVLFTPGPLTTTRSVKEAMLADIGSWDVDCIRLVSEIRAEMIKLCGGSRDDLTCTLLQGSGSYAVESILGSAIPGNGKLLILGNGAYGRRMKLIAEALRLEHIVMEDPEDTPHDPAALDHFLARESSITHVASVHCETTSGVLNPLREIGLVVQKHGRRFLVDAISSFGAYPVGPGQAIDFDAGPIDHMALSANKCIEGVPGFGLIISRREAMARCAGQARSLCLDLHGQWSYMETTGQFRYTPPTHVLLAFRQALRELELEGGIAARARRYQDSHRVLVEGMQRLGYKPYVAAKNQSHIITTFLYPAEDFDFKAFYDRLHARGFIIYPGKLTGVKTFRIANIGSIGQDEVKALLQAVAQ